MWSCDVSTELGTPRAGSTYCFTTRKSPDRESGHAGPTVLRSGNIIRSTQSSVPFSLTQRFLSRLFDHPAPVLVFRNHFEGDFGEASSPQNSPVLSDPKAVLSLEFEAIVSGDTRWGDRSCLMVRKVPWRYRDSRGLRQGEERMRSIPWLPLLWRVWR